MPIMAINLFQANMIQLLNETLDGSARTNADATVKERLSELMTRLKDPDNYAGQAGCNLYEDVSPCLYISGKHSNKFSMVLESQHEQHDASLLGSYSLRLAIQGYAVLS